MNDIKYFLQGCTFGFIGFAIKYVTLQEFLEKEAMQLIYATTTIIWFGLARMAWKRLINYRSKKTIKKIKERIEKDSLSYIVSQFDNHKSFIIDGKEVFSCKDNAALFETIKNKINFDELVWGEGDDTSPDWIYYSYNPSRKNKKQIKICTFDGESYTYTIV